MAENLNELFRSYLPYIKRLGSRQGGYSHPLAFFQYNANSGELDIIWKKIVTNYPQATKIVLIAEFCLILSPFFADDKNCNAGKFCPFAKNAVFIRVCGLVDKLWITFYPQVVHRLFTEKLWLHLAIILYIVVLWRLKSGTKIALYI